MALAFLRKFWTTEAPDQIDRESAGFAELIRADAPIASLLASARAVTSPDRVVADFENDPWLQNYALNIWEEAHQVDELRSYPWKVALPIADLCNARCTFCASWLGGKQVLSLDQLGRYTEVLPFARSIGLQGHGEPLANPQIDAILKRISEVTDPRATSYIISNGMFLKRRIDGLLDARVKTFNFSLNAVTNPTHHTVMGLGENALDTVLAGIRELIRLRESNPAIQVTISMVLTADNFHEAPDFIRLGNDLGVDWLYLRTLVPFSEAAPGLNYHGLAPILRPDFEAIRIRILEAAEASTVRVDMLPDTWEMDSITPDYREKVKAAPPVIVSRSEALKDKAVRDHYTHLPATKGGRGRFLHAVMDDGYNPYGREAPLPCSFIYQQLISTQLNFRIVPCCYMADVPGYEPVTLEKAGSFMEYWNSDAFVALRRTLRSGPLMNPCKSCPMQG